MTLTRSGREAGRPIPAPRGPTDAERAIVAARTPGDIAAFDGRMRRLEDMGLHAEAAAGRARWGIEAGPPSDPDTWSEAERDADPIAWLEAKAQADAEAKERQIEAMEAWRPPTKTELERELCLDPLD